MLLLKIERFAFLKKWIIENIDFKKTLLKYNTIRVFLYIDPPYLKGSEIYSYSFTMDQFRGLKDMLDEHKGSYILSLSMIDPEMIGIYGQPDLVIDHNQPTTLKQLGKSNQWDCGYWW